MNPQSAVAELLAKTLAANPREAIIQEARGLISLHRDQFGDDERAPDLDVLASLRGIRRDHLPPAHSPDAELVPDASGLVTMRVNSNRPVTRQRFSVAHEIGHTFFPGFNDRIQCRPDPRHRINARYVNDVEALCDVAAAELLFPDPWFAVDSAPVESAADLAELVTRYAASPEATLRRFAETRDYPCAAVFFGWKLKPVQIRSFGSLRGPDLFGDDAEQIARAARKLRVDYHVASSGFRDRGLHIAANKSVPDDSILLEVARTGTPAAADVEIDLGALNGRMRIWALPIIAAAVDRGPDGSVAVGAIVRPLTLPQRSGPSLFSLLRAANSQPAGSDSAAG